MFSSYFVCVFVRLTPLVNVITKYFLSDNQPHKNGAVFVIDKFSRLLRKYHVKRMLLKLISPPLRIIHAILRVLIIVELLFYENNVIAIV